MMCAVCRREKLKANKVRAQDTGGAVAVRCKLLIDLLTGVGQAPVAEDDLSIGSDSGSESENDECAEHDSLKVPSGGMTVTSFVAAENERPGVLSGESDGNVV